MTQQYIESAVLTSWKMATQSPQLLYKLYRTGVGNPYDERVQDAAADSDDPATSTFQYYVHPAVLLKKEVNKLLIKGKIMCNKGKK